MICPKQSRPRAARNSRHLAPPARARLQPTVSRCEPLEIRRLLITVTTALDVVDPNDGLVSLREAVQEALQNPGSDSIGFTPSVFPYGGGRTVTLTQGPLLIDGVATGNRVSIVATGPGTVAISAGGSSRIFEIGSGGDLSLVGLTLTGGRTFGATEHGGAIRNAGKLQLEACHFAGNVSEGDGGAIHSTTAMSTSWYVTFSDNTAFANGGALSLEASAHFRSSTFSRNTAVAHGGAVAAKDRVMLTGCTIVLNRADTNQTCGATAGGAIWQPDVVLAKRLVLHNSIVTGNTGGAPGAPNDIGSILDAASSSNIVGDYGSLGGLQSSLGNMFGRAVENVVGLDLTVDPTGGLRPAPDFNEPETGWFRTVPFHPLLTTSPAINAGNNSFASSGEYDTRGKPRRFQGRVDIGSYEMFPVFTLAVGERADVDDGDFWNGRLSLREAVNMANFAGGDQTITFAADAFPPTQFNEINLDGTALLIANPGGTTITGPGARHLTIDGMGRSNVFTVSANAVLRGLTISGGKGGVENSGTLTIDRCIIIGNVTDGIGGGILSTGSLTVLNSTITGNAAAHSGAGGGGIYTSGPAQIINSTISGNFSNYQGGGIHASSFDFTVIGSTIVNNRAAEAGGGVYIASSSAQFTLRNSIVAGNVIGPPAPVMPANDIARFVSVASSNNLIGDAATAGGLVDGVLGNIVGISGVGTRPLEQIVVPALRDNGGPTPTYALAAGSPAIDAASAALISGAINDQRGFGFPRIAGVAPDIGAFEVDAEPPRVTSASFIFSGYKLPAPPHRLQLLFNEELTDSPAPSDLFVQNLTSGAVVPSWQLQIGYLPLPSSSQVIFTAGPLADGNYRATLNSGAIGDASGNVNAGDFTFDFFVLSGDANRDRAIDIIDFSILASRFNFPGTFSQGDFNYNGVTEIGDFAILAGRFNTSLLPVAGRSARMTGAAPSTAMNSFASRGGAVEEALIDELL